jgi:hypothetical protein
MIHTFPIADNMFYIYRQQNMVYLNAICSMTEKKVCEIYGDTLQSKFGKFRCLVIGPLATDSEVSIDSRRYQMF